VDVLRTVSSDAEISPPLYFLAAWLFHQLGSAPELIRLPSLIAGTASIPLAFLAGRLSLSNTAGVVAGAVMAFNPFMVFYSTDGRAYTVAIALLLGTTVAMLLAARSGRTLWWVVYGLLTAACMYTHYTTAFVLGPQLLWLLWAYPSARRAALLTNLGAALLFAPWIPSLLEDLHSPTIDILSALQGNGFDVKRDAVEAWAFGYPYNLIDDVPGRTFVTVAIVAIAALGLAAIARATIARGTRSGGPPRLGRGMALAVIILLSTPLAELLLLGAGGSDLFGARNLNTASGGLALTIGGLVVLAGPIVGTVCGVAVLAVFGIGAARSLEDDVATIDFKDPARLIDERAGQDAVIVDMASPILTPAPLTSIDAYLPQDRTEYRLYLPEGPPPFLHIPPPPAPLLEQAIHAAAGREMFLISGQNAIADDGGRLHIDVPPPIAGVDESGAPTSVGQVERVDFPAGSRIVSTVPFGGHLTIVVYEIDVPEEGPR
jgi:hypothetical protein